MALFSRARQALKGRLGPVEPPPPQYYRLVCSEGHVLRGPRNEGYQALRCPGCGEGLFVLPRSPLPDPPQPAARAKKAATPVREAEEAPIEWVDPVSTGVLETEAPRDDHFDEAVAAELEESAPVSPARPQAVRPPKPDRNEPSPAPPAAEIPRPRPPKPRPQAAASRPAPATAAARQILVPERVGLRVRLHRYRHVLALAGVVGLVTATVAVRWYRIYWESLPKVAEAAREEGLTALADGKLHVAKQKLNESAAAFEKLRAEEAPAVRQLASEAAALADLSNSALEELVDQVAAESADGNPPSLTQRGRSVIVDTTVLTPGSGDKPPLLAYRVFSGNREGQLDLDGLDLFKGRLHQAGDPITFAARIDSIQLGSDNIWHVRFEPASGTFITSPETWKALEALGWSAHPATAAADPRVGVPAR